MRELAERLQLRHHSVVELINGRRVKDWSGRHLIPTTPARYGSG